MSRKLQKTSVIAATPAGKSRGKFEDRGDTELRRTPANGRAGMAAAGDGEQTPYEAPADVLPGAHSAEYILAMVHDLKKLAAKAGLQRVALILEMAELEARDQTRKPER